MRVRGNSCTKARCKRPGTEMGLCKTHLKQENDRLFSLIVRDRGQCESGRDKHAGNHQCAHGFGRRYLGTRWDERNAFCLCAGCHTFYTHHYIEWDLWLLDRWGVQLYTEIRERALSTDKTDLLAVYDRLVLRARELEVAA
jgi:hypothetical protein